MAQIDAKDDTWPKENPLSSQDLVVEWSKPDWLCRLAPDGPVGLIFAQIPMDLVICQSIDGERELALQLLGSGE
jgi:hypothetical protein